MSSNYYYNSNHFDSLVYYYNKNAIVDLSNAFINLQGNSASYTSPFNSNINEKPSTLFYKYKNTDISEYCVAFYTENNYSIPNWCNKIRAVLIGGGGTGGASQYSTFVIQINTMNNFRTFNYQGDYNSAGQSQKYSIGQQAIQQPQHNIIEQTQNILTAGQFYGARFQQQQQNPQQGSTNGQYNINTQLGPFQQQGQFDNHNNDYHANVQLDNNKLTYNIQFHYGLNQSQDHISADIHYQQLQVNQGIQQHVDTLQQVLGIPIYHRQQINFGAVQIQNANGGGGGGGGFVYITTLDVSQKQLQVVNQSNTLTLNNGTYTYIASVGGQGQGTNPGQGGQAQGQINSITAQGQSGQNQNGGNSGSQGYLSQGSSLAQYGIGGNGGSNGSGQSGTASYYRIYYLTG